MKQIKCIFNSFLLLTFITFVFNTQIHAFIEDNNSSQIVKKYTRVSPEVIKKFEKVASVESLFDLNIDDIPSFDEVFQLMESFIFIDEDELATLYTQEELDIINVYLIKMARIGVLPGDEEELEKDIEELLSDDDDEEEDSEDEEQYSFSTQFLGSSNYIASSEYKNWEKDIFCSNPIKKTIKSTKKAAKNTTQGLRKGVKKAGKFVKNNKAVVIAIVAVVVAGVTTYYIVSSNSSKPSSPTGLKNDSVKTENNNNSTILENVETTFDKDSLLNPRIEGEKPIAEVLNDNITSFKADIQNANIINIPESDQNIWDKTKEIFRDTSAHVSHKVLDEVSDYAKIFPMLMDEVGDLSKKFTTEELINDLKDIDLFGNQEKSILENYEEKIFEGHQKIDKLFAVNHSDNYAIEAKEYREKDFSIAILPPPSGLLKNAKALPNIKTPKDISNIMQPRGQWIGKKGNCERIRLFNGGKKEGIQIFKELTKDGKIIYKDSEKIISQLSDEIYITYRPISKSGPPTINIRLSNKTKPIKIKFIE
ncbi:MAG: hypothetical protein KR126chlam6_00655 [Candidatus Anoxychlamydiales bacterium]|nr:hypothetical protein [Candidatus Anoxychlamydiales bacterium]